MVTSPSSSSLRMASRIGVLLVPRILPRRTSVSLSPGCSFPVRISFRNVRKAVSLSGIDCWSSSAGIASGITDRNSFSLYFFFFCSGIKTSICSQCAVEIRRRKAVRIRFVPRRADRDTTHSAARYLHPGSAAHPALCRSGSMIITGPACTEKCGILLPFPYAERLPVPVLLTDLSRRLRKQWDRCRSCGLRSRRFL